MCGFSKIFNLRYCIQESYAAVWDSRIIKTARNSIPVRRARFSTEVYLKCESLHRVRNIIHSDEVLIKNRWFCRIPVVWVLIMSIRTKFFLYTVFLLFFKFYGEDFILHATATYAVTWDPLNLACFRTLNAFVRVNRTRVLNCASQKTYEIRLKSRLTLLLSSRPDPQFLFVWKTKKGVLIHQLKRPLNTTPLTTHAKNTVHLYQLSRQNN